MNRAIFFLLLLVTVVASLLQPSHAAETRSGSSACNFSVSELFLRKGDKNFDEYLQQVSSYFAGAAAAGPSGKVRRPVVSSNATSLSIEVEKSTCINLGRGGFNAPNSIGGCDYVGCTASLGAEFNHLPNGSTVKISTCGGGLKMTGSFFKNGQGQWVMTSYNETLIPGPEDCPVLPPE